MRLYAQVAFIAAIIVLIAAGSLPTGAQSNARDSVLNLEIPGFDYIRLLSEFYDSRSGYAPPDSPPEYAIGDLEALLIDRRETGEQAVVVFELRGMTEGTLIWVEENAAYSNWRSQRLAERVEAEVLGSIDQMFGYSPPPGIDGDPRLFVTLIFEPGGPWQGAFHPFDTLPTEADETSNQREWITVNMAYETGEYLDADALVSIIAHEYQHQLMHQRDPNEAWWLDEALATYATWRHHGGYILVAWAQQFLDSPNIGLYDFHLLDYSSTNYGAVGLFVSYLVERFGEGVMASLHGEELDGWNAMNRVLREGYGASADDVFADWVMANYWQDHARGYGYSELDRELSPAKTSAAFGSFPAERGGSLPQYSADYYVANVRGARSLSLQLSQAEHSRYIETSAPEGDFFYYAPSASFAYSTLTREIERMPAQDGWLEFKVWHDTEAHEEVGYAAVSVDGGARWRALRGRGTTDTRWLDQGYSGDSFGWVPERIRLSPFALKPALLRFGLMTQGDTGERGFAIDDLRIEALGIHDGFETDSGDWVAEGWLRTDNRPPQTTWLQVAQETDAGIHVERRLMSGSGELTVAVQPGASRAVIAVSPVVPLTALETEYSLVVNLLDEAGNVMTVSRDCQVTTTTGLNFRDAPNGDKIGLIPQGTEVDALDKRGEWYQVEYDGMVGWAHGGYVTARGNCP